MNHNLNQKSKSLGTTTGEVILKLIGLAVVVWVAARIIGWLISPGFILLAIALWLIVRSQRNKKQQPAQLTWVPQPTHPVPPVGWTYPYASSPVPPSPPRGYWAPTVPVPPAMSYTPQPVPYGSTVVMPAPAGQPLRPFTDLRTPAEREIEDYVERSWPNV
jgi:hypothetical protein